MCKEPMIEVSKMIQTLLQTAILITQVFPNGWMWRSSKCLWIKKQIELFHIHLSMHSIKH